MKTSSLFWNRAEKHTGDRAADPLGLDALREAMSNTLVPLLTGGTRRAYEFVWTLIGLRWAREHTGSTIDKDIFYNGFAMFERGLKQYWYYSSKRTGAGSNIIKQICQKRKPDLNTPILSDQRATGLLGSYIMSLRGMELVKSNSLLLNDDQVDKVLGGVKFTSGRNWSSSWDGLTHAFSSVSLAWPTRRIGVRLFKESDDSMHRAARAVLAVRKGNSWPNGWGNVAMRQLDAEQARIGRAAGPVAAFEGEALGAFATLLRGGRISSSTKVSLKRLARRVKGADPFPSAWKSSMPLRSAIYFALTELAAGRDPAETLTRLHLKVTKEIRGNEPWINERG